MCFYIPFFDYITVIYSASLYDKKLCFFRILLCFFIKTKDHIPKYIGGFLSEIQNFRQLFIKKIIFWKFFFLQCVQNNLHFISKKNTNME
ncbi:hypothetical protein EF405_21260 [Cyclobacteriaceae bacterium YHN15]|nr:hypothetical protein EF405_21260 [Cyclobacteriaceae bacterium YHN15]